MKTLSAYTWTPTSTRACQLCLYFATYSQQHIKGGYQFLLATNSISAASLD